MQRWLNRQPEVYFFTALPGSSASPVDAFASWCSTRRGTSVRLVLSGEFTHQYVVPLSSSQVLLGEARALFATRHFAQYYGERAQAWPLATWSGAQNHGACAAHGLDLTAVQSAAAMHRVRLLAVEPAWANVLRWLSLRHPRWAANSSVALVVVERTLITWLLCAQGTVVQVQQRRLQSASLQSLELRVAELRSSCDPAMQVWIAGFGLDGTVPLPADAFRRLNALDADNFPQELLQ